MTLSMVMNGRPNETENYSLLHTLATSRSRNFIFINGTRCDISF